MNLRHGPSTIDMYRTDLERHLFAPAPRRAPRLRAWPSLDVVSDWLRGQLLSGLARWKELSQAVNL
jgi:hypothetical protein